jgi:hypothetical protein
MYLDLIDEQAFTAFFGARTDAVWEAVEPFVRATDARSAPFVEGPMISEM